MIYNLLIDYTCGASSNCWESGKLRAMTCACWNSAVTRYVRSLCLSNASFSVACGGTGGICLMTLCRDVKIAVDDIKLKVMVSESNRVELYKTINPDLSVHEIYHTKTKVNERQRISWTRFRVSAHSLAIEERRWNRRGRGRLPMEERLCSCGHIQSEQHVVEDCVRTSHIRHQYNVTTLKNLLTERTDFATVCTIVHNILTEFN